MWDGWETTRGCLRRAKAEVRGYRRVFSKPSVRNWGTTKYPCPTLSLEKTDGAHCVGVAFEFSNNREGSILSYLADREGKDFVLHRLAVHVEAGDEIEAVVPIYQGKSLACAGNAQDVAHTVLEARGTSGPCVDYVKGIAEELRRMGIDDPAVSDLWGAVAQSRK